MTIVLIITAVAVLTLAVWTLRRHASTAPLTPLDVLRGTDGAAMQQCNRAVAIAATPVDPRRN